MGRPRRPFGGLEDISIQKPLWMQDEVPGRLGTNQRRRWEASTHWHYTVPNGLYDPLTYLFVLDLVAQVQPSVELRAKNVVEFLQQQRDQFHWDPVTVGRVMADICESFEDILGKGFGILERGQDYKGAFYLVHHNFDTANLYYKVRDELMKSCEIEMTLRERGKRTGDLRSPLLDCPSMRVASSIDIDLSEEIA